jgi:hypothetical protein
MAYQMQRLVHGMGRGMGSGLGDAEERLLDQINGFVALRPSSQWLGRFFNGIESARTGRSEASRPDG